MFGLGTIINTAAIVAGGLLGMIFGKFFKEEMKDAVAKICGVSVMFIGIAGALEGMLSVSDGKIVSGKSMLVVLCLAIGTVIGELIGIENCFDKLGNFLKAKTGNAKDASFVNAFVTASLTVCVGAMAIVGAINDGIKNDSSVLIVKSVLDFIIIAVMASSLGKGCIFSAVPVFIVEGLITLLARLIAPVMTETATEYLSLIGSILVFCVGINLVWGKKIRVANALPSILLAVAAAYIPWSL